jgi:O-antigen ligase
LVLHDTHNYYLKIAAEQGIVGLGLWLAFILLIALTAWRLTRIGKTPQSKGIGFATLGCITAVMICNFFGDRFSQIEIGGTLMLIFAMTQRQAHLDTLNSPIHS